MTVFFLRKMNLVQIKEATYLLLIFITAENTVVRLLELDTSLIFEFLCSMSPWRNRLARSAVNRKVGGSSPPGDESFCNTSPTPAGYE